MTDLHGFEEEEFTTQFNGQTLMRTMAQTKSHWPLLVGFLLCITVVALTDSITTYLGMQIIDEGIIPGDREALVRLFAIYVVLIFISAGMVFGFIYFAGILGETVQYDLRQKLFFRLQDLSFAYFDQTPVGWIMSRVTSDTQRMGELVSWGLLDVTWSVTRILTAFIFMLIINWQLALIVALVIPILLVVAVQFKKKIFKYYGR